MSKILNECVLYDRKCIDCCECDICDLDKRKICNNCGKCIENKEDYLKYKIDKNVWGEEK